MIEQKFKKGDRVRIINYGHSTWYAKGEQWEAMAKADADFKNIEFEFWTGEIPKIPHLPKEKPDNILFEDENIWTVDIKPNLVGKEGIVEGSYADLSEIKGWGSTRDERNQKQYSIKGIKEKSAWYDEQQLELIQ